MAEPGCLGLSRRDPNTPKIRHHWKPKHIWLVSTEVPSQPDYTSSWTR
jgi:hypothetical protein